MNTEGKMSASESSSSSSSSESSPPSSPEAPKKTSQSPSGATEASKKASNSILEEHKESNTTRPSQRVSKSPSSSPEAKGKVRKLPAKGLKQSDTSVKSHKASKSPSSSPESSAKVPKSQKVSKSPSSSPEAPAKVPNLPPRGCKESATSTKSHKVSRSPSSSPEAKAKVPKLPTKGRKESATSIKSHKMSRSPSSSPEASDKVPKSLPEELKDTNSSEPPKKLSPSASEDSEPPIILPKPLKSTQKSQPPRCHEDSGKDIAHPKESSEVQKSSASPLGPEAAFISRPNRPSFKSSLQVMLKRQEQELEKSIVYKEKLESGELDEDEDEGVGTKEAVGGKQERRGSEGNLVDEKRKEKQEGVDERVTRGEQEKKKSKKGKPKEDGDVHEKIKEKEEKKAQEEKEMEGRKKEAAMEERAKKEEKQMKRKEEEEKEREMQMKRKEKEEEMEKRKQEEEMRKAEAGRKEKKKKEERKESVKAVKSAAKEEKFHGSLYMKRKRTFNPWKEYYFVLDGLLLTYYSSKHQYDDLSGMKGSLDLTLVEEVQPRKPGFLKTHHPFCLTRRNLSSINLAAATKEDQHRWQEILGAAIRPHRISSHSSDRTLHTTASAPHAAAAADPTNKASTLPSRVKDLNSYASSVSEEEEKEEEEEEEPELIKKEVKEKEEEEVKKEEDEEEPELIKPKKVLKVPIGLPLGMVNLGEVKLKKLEKKEVKEEDRQTTSTAAAAAAVATTHNTTQDDTRETSPPGELFGVVLKKTRKPEEKEKEKEAPKDTTPTPPIPAKRPSKQPVIPLNSGKLLVVPTAKSPKTSPATQKRQTPERRKSPSPSLPISKSVQALTKSAEEVKATQVNVASSEPPAAASTTTLTSAAAGRGKSGIKLCHAQTMEVKYNNVEVMKEAEEVVEVKAAKREEEEEETEKQDVTKKEEGVDVESQKKGDAGKEVEVQEAGKDAQEEKKIREDAVVVGDEPHHEEDKEAAAKTRPQDPLMGTEDKDAVRGDLKASKDTQERGEKLNKELQNIRDKKTVSEASADDQSREDNSEGAASPPTEAPSVPSPLTPPASPASSQASAGSGRSSPPSSPAAPPSESSSSSTKSSPSSPKSIPSSLKSSLLKKEEEEERSVEAWPLEAGRHRADTGESTASSTTESGEKKPGKLHRLKKKLKSSTSFKKEKEEPRKRRGSNSLTALLAGKKNGGKKHAEEPQPHASQGGATSKPPASPHHTVTAAPHQMVMASSEPPPAEAPLPPDQGLPRVNLQEAHPNPLQRAEDSQLAQMDSALAQMDSVLAQMDRSLGGQPSVVDAAAPSLRSSPGGEASPDKHIHLSVDAGSDQPPSIPKKTRMRAKSPNHDVPTSNRPVTNIQLMGMNDEDEPSQTVDGYITEEQIEALLMAKENKNKRKQSKSRTQVLLSVPDAEKGASLPAATSSPSTEEWGPRRPAFNSFSSIESEESMPATNFLGAQRGSSSSGSLRGVRRSLEADGDEHTSLTASDSGESLSPEAESPMEHQRRAPRPTDAITAKNRLSLTSPEFTVQEEEGLSSPETAKARPPCPGDDDDDKDKRKQENDDDKVEAGTKAEAKEEEEADSEAEQENFFPVVGGDVQMRQPPAHLAAALDLHKGELRTSGIVSLKEYLRTQEEDLDKVKSGISRLGHSAAVEKLKQASSEP